ncbi:MAG: hypothetical protein GWP08_18270 [Nitrospiraceae bacterium]|nr:hypothetical protein [Nitrospiraceae bacterium]
MRSAELFTNRPLLTGFVDRALRDGMPLVSLIWHPWSLHRLDPEMRMLDITFDYVAAQNLKTATFQTFLNGHTSRE